jgi:hypothetical protein
MYPSLAVFLLRLFAPCKKPMLKRRQKLNIGTNSGNHRPFSQSPRNRILWILANSGGKMERSRLRARTGMSYALLNPILEELAREGRIRISGEMIKLI